mgnify:CR=1 FL=1
MPGLAAYGGVRGGSLWQRYGLWFMGATVCLVAGLIVGVVMAADMAHSNSQLATFADGFLNALPGLTMDSTLETGAALAGNWRFFAFLWFLGLSLFGIPCIGGLLFLKGFALGFSVSFLVGRQVSAGLLVSILGVLPQNLLLIPAVLLGGTLAAVFSRQIWQGRVGARQVALYSGCFALLLLVGAVAAWLQGYVAPALLQGVLAMLS